MKFSIKKNILENLLITAQPFLEKKDLSQITSHILFNIDEDILKVYATDFEIGFSYETKNIKVESQGNVTANGKVLIDIVKKLKDDLVILEKKQNFLHIKQEKSNFKLPVFDANDYPSFPTLKEEKVMNINSSTFFKMIKKISPSIDSNHIRAELNGALVDLKNESINIVGTDTKRLAIINTDGNFEESQIIISKKAILEIQKIELENLNFYYDETNFIIKNEEFLFFTKLMRGKFPAYEKILPKEYKIILELSRDKIIEAIKQISTISDITKITFFENNILFESLSDDNSEGKTQIEHEMNLNEEIHFSVKNKYILDFLNNIQTSNFTLKYNEPTLPFLLKSENFKTLVMPMLM